MATGAGSTVSRCAVYSQSRRDNEVEAREELTKQLPAHAFHSRFNTCGEFNLTTKTLIATLLLLDPDAEITQPTSTHKTSVQYNQLRRDNEATIRDKLKALIPENFFTPEITERSDFNPTTKIIISASLHLREVLQEAADNQLQTSNPAIPRTMTHSSRSYSMDLDEIPDSQDEGFEALEQDSTVPLRDSAPIIRQEKPLGRADHEAPHIPMAVPILPKCITLPLPETRNRRLRSRTLLPNSSSESSPPNTFSNTEITNLTNDTSRPYDDYEILANLRTEQQNQDMGLDLKPPPPLPKKAQIQGRWELKLKNPKALPHRNEHIRALEQVTNRLVAKAQEMILVMDGDDAACEKPLQEAHDMCVDTIAMFEGDLELKQYRKKWMAKKAEWAKEYDLEF